MVGSFTDYKIISQLFKICTKTKNKSLFLSCSVFIVSTMDGKVQALDARDKGKKLWSVQADTQPLLSSSISKLEVSLIFYSTN